MLLSSSFVVSSLFLQLCPLFAALELPCSLLYHCTFFDSTVAAFVQPSLMARDPSSILGRAKSPPNGGATSSA